LPLADVCVGAYLAHRQECLYYSSFTVGLMVFFERAIFRSSG
jgi:hypothetical protein